MAVETSIGPERNLFDPQPESAHQIELRTPILFNDELEQIRALDGSAAARGFKATTLPILYDPAGDGPPPGSAPPPPWQKAPPAPARRTNITVSSSPTP